MFKEDKTQNVLVGSVLFAGVLLTMAFGTALLGSHAGEVASALGSVVGGAFGALGAAGAVYLTLKGQRQEDSERIRSAVIKEIVEFSTIAMSILDLCEAIRSGSLEIPMSDLARMVDTPRPIIYSAVAANIGILRSPHRIVGFYMKFITAKMTADIMSGGPLADEKMLDGDNIRSIANSLAMACQLAKLIIEDSDADEWFDQAVSEGTLSRIDGILERTVENFELGWEVL